MLILGGCGFGRSAPAFEPEAEAVGAATQNIWRGQNDANDAWSNAVVYLEIPAVGGPNAWSRCTGTLITSRLVLTASHCPYGSTGSTYIPPDPPSPNRAGTKVHFGNNGGSWL
jgi:hypothetical protein